MITDRPSLHDFRGGGVIIQAFASKDDADLYRLAFTEFTGNGSLLDRITISLRGAQLVEIQGQIALALARGISTPQLPPAPNPRVVNTSSYVTR